MIAHFTNIVNLRAFVQSTTFCTGLFPVSGELNLTGNANTALSLVNTRKTDQTGKARVKQ